MKYKGFLLATAGGVASVSGAHAADMGMPLKAPPAPVPVATWTGWYAGINVGLASQFGQGTYDPASAGNFGGLSGSGLSLIGGGQVGYNWQNGMYVFGLEADIAGLTGKASGLATADDDGKGNGLENKISWLGTVRGKLGYLLKPDILAYATGGLAYGHVHNVFDANGINICDGVGFCNKTASKTKVGWTAGGGIDYMLSEHWIIGIEALYVDLGKTTGTNIDGSKTSTFKNSAALTRLKVDYKF